MSQDSSARYYQENRKSFQKKLVNGIKIFLKKIKTKSDNLVASDIKIFLSMKNRG